MSLQPNDLFIVQDSGDKKLYNIKFSQLEADIQAGSVLNFRGYVNLNNGPSGQLEVDPQQNGDVYINNADAATINGNWTMTEGVTSAQEGDRVVWVADPGEWILVSSGGEGNGIVEGIQGTSPVQVDNSNEISTSTAPVVSVQVSTKAQYDAADASTEEQLVDEKLLRAVIDDVVPEDGTITTINVGTEQDPPARWKQRFEDKDGTPYYDGTSDRYLNIGSAIKVTGTDTAPTLAIGLAGLYDHGDNSNSRPGLFFAPNANDIDPSLANLDQEDGGMSEVHAVTPNRLFQFYVPRNFELLNNIDTPYA